MLYSTWKNAVGHKLESICIYLVLNYHCNLGLWRWKKLLRHRIYSLAIVNSAKHLIDIIIFFCSAVDRTNILNQIFYEPRLAVSDCILLLQIILVAVEWSIFSHCVPWTNTFYPCTCSVSVASCCFGQAILWLPMKLFFERYRGKCSWASVSCLHCSCVCQTETAVSSPLRSICLEAKKKRVKSS